MIIAGCGHIARRGYKVCWKKGVSKDGIPYARYTTFCLKCYKKYKKQNLILDTRTELNSYLKDKVQP